MSQTGIERKIDEMGRIVIPKQIRKELGLNINDTVEVMIEEGRFVVYKSVNTCIFCHTEEELLKVKDKKYICTSCKENMDQL